MPHASVFRLGIIVSVRSNNLLSADRLDGSKESDFVIQADLDSELRVRTENCGRHIKTYWLSQTQSTNDDVKHLIEDNDEICTYAVVTEKQTHGKGTHGRVWHSPKASLLLTVGVPVDYKLRDAQGLTLVIGARVLEVLRTCNANVSLKWPNDLWLDGRKICGISCEAVKGAGHRLFVVAGIGINIALDASEVRLSTASGYASGALLEHVPDVASLKAMRLHLATLLIERLSESISGFTLGSLEEIRAKWHDIDALANSPVAFTTPDDQIYCGVIKGIGPLGQVQIDDGVQVREFFDGTLRPRA